MVEVVEEGGSCDRFTLGKRTGNKIYRTASVDVDVGGGCVLNYTTTEAFTVASDNSSFTGVETVTVVLTTGATCKGLPVLTPCTSSFEITGTLCQGCYSGCSSTLAPFESEPVRRTGLPRGWIDRARLRR